MASTSYKINFGSLLFLVLLLSVSATTSNNEDSSADLNRDLIAEALQNKGYGFMSLMYSFLADDDDIIPEKGVVTMFCVRDESIKIQPSGSVIRSHVVPLKLNRESIEAFGYGKRLDTINPGHHLMVTSTAKSKTGLTINDMAVEDWDIYNNGRIVIHGIRDYFEDRIDEKNDEL